MHRTVLSLATAAALVLAACGGGTEVLNTDSIESQIQSELGGQTGVVPTSVQCPDEVPVEAGGTFICTAFAEDGSTATITVTQVDNEGHISWEVTATS